MGYTTRFTDDACREPALAGGTGVNLGRLSGAGFPVPDGFVVTTQAYRDFLATAGLSTGITEQLTGLDYRDVDAVESAAARIRSLITSTELPEATAAEISEAYRALGDSAFVAVRSSGTAEDLAGASFAGLHDTFLDVRGAGELVRAVRDCWASLWTARALAYRHDKGFDHLAEGIAVVVQIMVESECSGVMFTANPVSGVNDEFVVNAAWGLGEGIVSGVVSPDEFALRSGDLSVRRKTLGSKAVKVVRNPSTGSGTATVDVAAADRDRYSLSDDQLAELGMLGRRIAAYYDGLPQDIEWALLDGALYILQSRDVTGIDFTWDEDCDSWQTIADDESTVWSRGYADQYLTGAITPLFYSVRIREFTRIHERYQKLLGFDDLAGMRPFRYYRAEAYYNSRIDATYYTYVLPPSMRAGAFAMCPQYMIDEALRAPFSLGRYLRALLRVTLLEPDQRVYRWFAVIENYLHNRQAEADGLTDEELDQLGDTELMKYTDKLVDRTDRFIGDEWIAFFLYAPTALFALSKMLEKWYDGDNPNVFGDLLSGLPQQSTTVLENNAIWELAEMIRRNPELRGAFDRSTDATFFDEIASLESAAEFREKYQALVDAHGHRGHADRDFFYDRRKENSALDYRAFAAFLNAEGDAPTDREAQLIQQRESLTADVIGRIRRSAFGAAKAEVFKAVLDYCHRFLIIRDDQRHFVDRFTFAKKRAFLEMGRRLTRAGRLADPTDCYFLSKEELYDVLRGIANPRLVRAKISGRRKAHARFDAKEELPPPYLVNNVGADLDGTETVADSADGVYAGLATSRGTYTGTARVITELSAIGQIRKGDILITNSTDPGWTPVFMVIGALVLETGGMLSHGACLSREYGFPSITVPNAAKRIPDGARITVNGDSGQVLIHSETVEEPVGV
jgi:pyruvate,water dikinase